MVYESSKGDMNVALVGDCLLHKTLLSNFREESYLDLIQLIQDADLSYANLEGVIHQYQGPPGAREGAFPTAFHPRCLEELQWMGFDMVSCANNHSMDYGEWAALNTIDHLEQAGLVHAGTGRSLFEARAPGYLELAAGRVALISVTTTFEPHERAGEQTPQVEGRPGANCLGSELEYVVDQTTLQYVRGLGEKLGDEARKERGRQYHIMNVPDDTDSEHHFLGKRFVQGEEFTVRSRCNPRDKAEILRRVEDATRQAEWVIVATHCHEYDSDPEPPPAFLQDFARSCIDAGATCFVGHGPHYLKAVEIYKERPIFYSLGNFIVQLETIPRYPASVYQFLGLGLDALPGEAYSTRIGDYETFHMAGHPKYWRSVVPICTWRSGKLAEIKLHPLDLGYKTHLAARGRPLLADGDHGEETLDWLRQLSLPMGTDIRMVDGTGVITLA